MYVRAGRPAFARPYVGFHRSTSLMSSSLLLQQCPACLVRLAWIVFEKKKAIYIYVRVITLVYTYVITKTSARERSNTRSNLIRVILNIYIYIYISETDLSVDYYIPAGLSSLVNEVIALPLAFMQGSSYMNWALGSRSADVCKQ